MQVPEGACYKASPPIPYCVRLLNIFKHQTWLACLEGTTTEQIWCSHHPHGDTGAQPSHDIHWLSLVFDDDKIGFYLQLCMLCLRCIRCGPDVSPTEGWTHFTVTHKCHCPHLDQGHVGAHCQLQLLGLGGVTRIILIILKCVIRHICKRLRRINIASLESLLNEGRPSKKWLKNTLAWLTKTRFWDKNSR